MPLYTECLKSSKPDVQEGAAKGVWALAFDDDSLKRILDEPGCMSCKLMKQSLNLCHM